MGKLGNEMLVCEQFSCTFLFLVMIFVFRGVVVSLYELERPIVFFFDGENITTATVGDVMFKTNLGEQIKPGDEALFWIQGLNNPIKQQVRSVEELSYLPDYQYISTEHPSQVLRKSSSSTPGAKQPMRKEIEVEVFFKKTEITGEFISNIASGVISFSIPPEQVYEDSKLS